MRHENRVQLRWPVWRSSLYNIYTQGTYQGKKQTLQAGDKLIINTAFGNKKELNCFRNGGVKTNVFNYIDLIALFCSLLLG